MPGHKRNPMFFPQNLPHYDITEIPGMDVLANPTGILKSMQNSIAEFYCADESYLLVNGSTAGIIAAICAVSDDNSKLYAARNGHISMYGGLAASGAKPIYIQPDTTSEGLAGGINAEAFANMDEGTAAIIVSPTYEGFVSNIKSIADKIHSRGGILIVDEAHGAHFNFHKFFPTSALDLGADIVVQSFHKTLPALGQLAVLHTKGSRVDSSRLNFFVQAAQTSSPSYMLMAQLDYILNMLRKRPELFEMYVNRLINLRSALASTEVQPINLVDPTIKGQASIYDIDQGKLLFNLKTKQTAFQISEILSTQNRLQMEMAAKKHMLAMTSVADTDEGIQRLWAAIGALNIKLETSTSTQTVQKLPIPEQVLTPRQAAFMPTETVPWDKAIGRISAEIITDVPPGIALVAPGERILKGLPPKQGNVRVVKINNKGEPYK